ncbi:MAG: tRNA (N6-isopentenyl adenosine(37)-C2)-methylthiotransferase MiaB [Pontiellaceae bacterium]|nr:tRNA (N6-isopentenyl adenosine(37)-C2)-methylthiotransferase MiaB [Pontiellaceae bacterium]
MKCCIVTLGCQMNQSDSERIRSVIEGMGYAMTKNEEEADLIGVVACSVRQKAIDKVYAKIHRWNRWKNERPLITFVSGCILPADEGKFLKLFDLVFRMNELPELPSMLQQCGIATEYSLRHPLEGMERQDERTDFWLIDPAYSAAFEAYVPIQNGCDKFCTYCAVPYTRGREVSRASADILAEVQRLVDQGVKSITLLGQNVNSYGLDKKGKEISFAELLCRVGEIGNASDKDFWVYFTSPHPRDMTRDVIEAVAGYDCLAKQIHLPVQSGDEELLRRMNRNYSMETYLKIVSDIRELLPTATLFTDIIVGFSGETEAQFANTAALMERVEFNMAYIAKYSPRVGARSAEWEDDVPPQEKSERLARLSEILKRTSLAHNQAMVGKSFRVLLDGKDRRMEGSLTGRTEGKLPIRVLDADEERIGTFQEVEVISAAELSLTGRLVK